MRVVHQGAGSTTTINDSKAFASFADHVLTVDFEALGKATANITEARHELTVAATRMANATASAQGEAQKLREAVAAIEARMVTIEQAVQFVRSVQMQMRATPTLNRSRWGLLKEWLRG